MAKRLMLSDLPAELLTEPQGPYNNFVRVYKPNAAWMLPPSDTLESADQKAREISKHAGLSDVYAVGFFDSIEDLTPYRIYGLYILGEMFTWDGDK